jgi:hypothetical protein
MNRERPLIATCAQDSIGFISGLDSGQVNPLRPAGNDSRRKSRYELR